MGLRGFANTPIVTEGRLPWSQWCYCPWSLWRYCRPQMLGEGESLTPQTQMKRRRADAEPIRSAATDDCGTAREIAPVVCRADEPHAALRRAKLGPKSQYRSRMSASALVRSGSGFPGCSDSHAASKADKQRPIRYVFNSRKTCRCPSPSSCAAASVVTRRRYKSHRHLAPRSSAGSCTCQGGSGSPQQADCAPAFVLVPLVPLADIAATGRGIRSADYLCRDAPFHCRGGLQGVAFVPGRSCTAHDAALRPSPIIRLEGTMRVIFPLPPLLVAGAALGGLFVPFAVGGAPTDTLGIAAATERQVGADVAICHGSASAGVTRIMLRLAQARTEVPQAEMQAASPAAAFADTDPPLWEGLGGVTYRITTANELAQSYSIKGSGSPTRSITARRSAPSARRRSSIPTAPCASGAKRWCSGPTSICRCRKTRWRQPSRQPRRRACSPSRRARASRR